MPNAMNTTDRPAANVDAAFLVALQTMRRVLETVADGLTSEITDALDVLKAEQDADADRRLREIQDALEDEGDTEGADDER